MPDKVNLFYKRVYILWNQIFLTCVGVEVAVGAAVFAKGDVKVDGDVSHVRLIIRARRAGNKS